LFFNFHCCLDKFAIQLQVITFLESGIKQKYETGARCNITGIFYLKNDRSWQEASPQLLYLGWAENDTKLFVSFYIPRIFIQGEFKKVHWAWT
jgi:hypothetical protein